MAVCFDVHARCRRRTADSTKYCDQPDGTKKLDLTSTTVHTDMWEPWLIDAIVAAHEAVQAASKTATPEVCTQKFAFRKPSDLQANLV